MKTELTLFVAVIAVALFGMGCASTETNSDPLKNGLVTYYPFDGNAKDSSGNGLDGKPTNCKFVPAGSDANNKAASLYSFFNRYNSPNQ